MSRPPPAPNRRCRQPASRHPRSRCRRRRLRDRRDMTAPVRAGRRNLELGLMLLAGLLTVGAYVLASLGRTSSLPADVGPFLVVMLGLGAVAHIAVRRLAPAADGMLLPLAALLNGLGYVFIARLDHDLAALQAMWTAL